MTIEIRADVARSYRGTWSATVEAVDDRDPGDPIRPHWHMFTDTWPEAMQAAYAMRKLLDELLMRQVHQSRATRRTTQGAHQ